MSYRQQLEKLGATPGKLALIGVLAIVLVMVIVKQLPKSASNDASTSPAVAVQSPSQAGNATTGKTVTTSLKKKGSLEKSELPKWPVFELSETLASDPFAAPSWFAQEEPESIVVDADPGELAELQEQGASIVVIAEGQKSARIGELKYHVGDILEGYRVTDITTQGIVLNKLSPQ